MEKPKDTVEKQLYIKPEIVKVELVAEEAVLGCGKDDLTPCAPPTST
jgi:hypothetical protein